MMNWRLEVDVLLGRIRLSHPTSTTRFSSLVADADASSFCTRTAVAELGAIAFTNDEKTSKQHMHTTPFH